MSCAWMLWALLALQDPAPPPPEPPVETPVETPPIETPPAPETPEQEKSEQEEPAPDAPPAAATPAAVTPAPAAPLAPMTEAAYEAELARLAAAHPQHLGVAELGASRLGRRIALLALGDRTGDVDERPAVLLATGFEAAADGRPRGPEAALFTVRALLERAQRDVALAELFADVTLYVVPAPDPDALYAPPGGPARTCRLDRNFPAGWQASDSIDCPQGPYPCSEPETRELARLVAGRANIGALVVLRAAAPAVPANEIGAAEPGQTRLVERLCDKIGLEPARVLAAQHAALSEPGSLAAFARARRGAFVLALDPWSGGLGGPSGTEPPAELRRVPVVVERLVRELPRLAAHAARTERLREKLWLVEVEVQDAGLLPTACAEERRHSPASVWFEAEGARITHAGIRRTGAPAANLDVPKGRVWRLGHLEGGESVRLYLAVEGEAGATLTLTLRSLRGASARLSVVL